MARSVTSEAARSGLGPCELDLSGQPDVARLRWHAVPPRPVKLDAALKTRARRALLRSDPRLAAVMRRAGACPLRPAGRPYAHLVRSILYQQLAGAAASAIEGRFQAIWGGRTPRPDELLRVRATTLRTAGLSHAKIRAVKSVAETFASGAVRERRLWHLDDDAVLEALTVIHGVGAWTVHMLLMSSLGRPDVLPVGDYGVRKGAQKLYELDEMPKPAELEALAEPWRPYRSVASWYLWRHDEIDAVLAAGAP
jgi:DNA-3-methyladenine glycosylase II